jgi:hypothetical protein
MLHYRCGLGTKVAPIDEEFARIAGSELGTSEPFHPMRVGADDLGPVSWTVGSVADNVGRCAVPVSVNLGWHGG